MLVQSYLFFDGRCEEAIEFYKKALGAKVDMMMRYKDSPEPQPAGHNVPGEKVMHASFRIGDTQVMASDGHNTGKPNFQGFSLSITVPKRTGSTVVCSIAASSTRHCSRTTSTARSWGDSRSRTSAATSRWTISRAPSPGSNSAVAGTTP